jgi:glucose-6-phosphate 1-dehydrogenase
MQEIHPSVVPQDIICVEAVSPPTGIVVFGASGDLTSRKLLPSLFQLRKRDVLTERFYLLGCGRKNLTSQQFRQIARQTVEQDCKETSAREIAPFLDRLYYTSCDYDGRECYEGIKTRLMELDNTHEIDGGRIFYLAVPPFLYGTIAERLGTTGLSKPDQTGPDRQVRLVVEKPFGRDQRTAAELNAQIRQWFDESQIYRIDHYLGKETVQNIMVFRFANTIFEPVWNRNHIDSVQITIAEKLGIEHRASYYDKSGALRDMFQNHMLQMLALVAMEPPTSFDADRIRDEKVKLLRAIRAFDTDNLDKLVVRGRYGPGSVDGQTVAGYRDEEGVAPDSKTETFVAAKLFIDNWRWKGVPFYLRTGKKLKSKDTEIAITFKHIPHSMFVSADLGDMSPNVLVLQIQPHEGISLSFQAKRPGSKISMSTLNMSFCYHDVFSVNMPEAYQRLLLDCMLGDQTLFTRYDAAETAWRLLGPILEAWQGDDSPPYEYPAGCDSFDEADRLIEADGRKWRALGRALE